MRHYLGSLPVRTRKLIVGVAGGAVLFVGVIMIPYPGPGWLVVFMGLAILSQEFPWARRALHDGRHQYDKWVEWIKHQNPFIQSLTFIVTTVVVVATIWLFNGYGLLNDWFSLGQEWLKSPLLW